MGELETDNLVDDGSWECDLCGRTHSEAEAECPSLVEVVVSDYHGMNMPRIFASQYDPDQFTSGYSFEHQEILLHYPAEEVYASTDDFVEAVELYEATWRDVVEDARIVSEEEHTESRLEISDGGDLLMRTVQLGD